MKEEDKRSSLFQRSFNSKAEMFYGIISRIVTSVQKNIQTRDTTKDI